MSVAILVPRRVGDAHREAVWDWVRGRWAEDLPGVPIVEGHHDDGGPFNRSAAINAAALEAGDWTVAVIIDADSVLGTGQAVRAVNEAARTGELVLAYDRYCKLNRGGTARVLAGDRSSWEPHVRTELANACSGALAVRRDLWDTVGGFDAGFVGWGWEDVAFSLACEALGGRRRIPGTLWHLWHPKSPERAEASPTFAANRARGDRYKAAKRDAAAMRALLEELRS